MFDFFTSDFFSPLRRFLRPATLAAAVVVSAVHFTASAADDLALPPVRPWNGASERLLAPPEDPWITPAETSGLTTTPRYTETMAWLERLAAAFPELNVVSIGRSAEGREIRMAIADRDGLTDPEKIAASGRAVVLAHGGIHAGEIDGKDAGLMLLRDLTAERRQAALLDKATWLFVPILNVDGHERFTAYGRVNQRGPEEMGWRTNGRNLNLNRDFAKLETEEIGALVRTVNLWQPDLYLDLHVTDGADYQYDITYGWNGPHGWSPHIADWLDQRLRPAVNAALSGAGHIPGPLIFAANGRDMADGMLSWTAGPRFSNGWGDARHLPSILVENHSLKPYRQRVLGTYVLLAEVLRIAGDERQALRQAVTADRYAERATVPLTFAAGEAGGEIDFLGIRSRLELSPISGQPEVRWSGEPVSERIPLKIMDQPVVAAGVPDFYYIPPAWYPLADKLRQQGIVVDVLDAPRRLKVERYRLPEAALDTANTPFEGRARYSAGMPQLETASVELPAGSFRIDTRQSLGTLAALLLEPASPDSFFQWGYLAEILQPTEYFERYAMEPEAERMLAADEALRERFQQKLLADPGFAADPVARLHWFYEQTPYFDQRYRLYPVYRAGD